MPEHQVNVLFTSANWRVGLLNAFRAARTHGPEIPGNVIVTELNPLAASLQACDAHFLVPPLQAPDYAERLLTICRDEKVTAVIPLIDKDLPVLDGLRDELVRAGVTPLLAPTASIGIANDKFKTYEFLRDQGFPTPKTWVVEDAFEPESFPLLLKPRHGEGSKQVFLVRDAQELKVLSGRIGKAVAQEVLDGKEYTIDVLCDLTGRPLSAVPRERIATRGGEIQTGRTVYHEAMIQTALAIAVALKVVGPATFQCFTTEDSMAFIDLNLRFGSGAPLAFAAGADYPRMLLEMLSGRPQEPIVGQFKRNLFMLRYDEAFYCSDPATPSDS